ncbi:MAG TPA: 2OG-Fe(II) oxygenase, partial [Spongiibacteraceae bacterium]|nr:2OG-Fe(II) oxygenase [Spongiibacteraceae bacterium]
MPTHLARDILCHSDTIAAALHGDGWLVLPDFLPAQACDALLTDCQQRRAEFVAAAVGRGTARQQLSEQRSDVTLWLRDDAPAQRDFLVAMDRLREEINRRLFLGLHDYEAHYAYYAPGSFYRRHRDAFASSQLGSGAPQRILTSVIYLNTAAGGELRLWRDEREL